MVCHVARSCCPARDCTVFHIHHFVLLWVCFGISSSWVFLRSLCLGQRVVRGLAVLLLEVLEEGEEENKQTNQQCGVSGKSKPFSYICIFLCTLTKFDFRWKYAIDSVLEVHIRRYTQMWSWSNIKKHRQLLKSYKIAYKSKLTQTKVSEELQKQIQVCFER